MRSDGPCAGWTPEPSPRLHFVTQRDPGIVEADQVTGARIDDPVGAGTLVGPAQLGLLGRPRQIANEVAGDSRCVNLRAYLVARMNGWSSIQTQVTVTTARSQSGVKSQAESGIGKSYCGSLEYESAKTSFVPKWWRRCNECSLNEPKLAISMPSHSW